MPVPRGLSSGRGPVASMALLGLLLGLGLGACTDDEPASKSPPPTPSTPLASYATDEVALDRGPFCEDLSDSAIEDALGGPVTSSTTYGNGDRARLTDDVRDVAHEYDCTYTAANKTAARAWLFAPPIPAERARELGRDARRTKGCRPQPDAPAFGKESVALVCAADAEVTASYRGLFGDAWLTFSLAVPSGGTDDQDLLDRAGRWCVQAAEAAAS